jgi:hypothetical protein
VTPRKTPSDEQLREAFSEVGDALQRAVVLSSDRVQSVFEDAVLRGRMTRRDAEELASSLVALGRDQAQELRGEVDALARSFPARVADVVADAAEAVTPRTRSKKRRATEAPSPNGKAAASSSGQPTPTLDAAALPAKDLIALVASLSPSELSALRAQEAAGKARATVLRAIDAKLKA